MGVLKFHSIQDFVSLLPKDTLTVREAEKLLEQHGTYRQFGNKKVLTERDITDLLQRVSARKTNPPEPRPDEAGCVVFLGNPAGNSQDDLIWIGWCPIDQELDLLDRVQLGSQERIMVLTVDNATYEDVGKLKTKLTASRARGNPYGHWFHRTDEVMSEVQRIHDGYTQGDDE